MSRSKTMLPVIFISLLLAPAFILGGTVWSNTPVTFNATSPLYMNWSNSYVGNITLGINSSYSGRLTVDNSTHTVSSNYSQPTSGWWYSIANTGYCGLGSYTFDFLVRNESGYYKTTENFTGTTWMALERKASDCPPGRYWGFINVTNSTNSSHYTTVEVVMNLPISSSNSLNTTGEAQLRGDMSASPTTYHSYYFNTSEIENATSLYVDQNSFQGCAFVYNESGIAMIDDYIVPIYQNLPKNETWEIRVYDESDGYSGCIGFTTLNATNTSDGSHLSLIDFGNLSASDTRDINMTLENEGSLNMESIGESIVLYQTEEFGGSTVSKNFTFGVLDSTLAIMVELNWTGDSNYTLKLYNSTGDLVSTHQGIQNCTKVFGGSQKEYLQYFSGSVVGLQNDGLWKVEVNNTDGASNPHNLTVEQWLCNSPAWGVCNWFESDYSTRTFNQNDEVNITSNFTVQNQSLAGEYEAYLVYTNTPESYNLFTVPISFNITSPEIFVNNTFNSSTVTVRDNIGFNRTVELNIPVKNTGNQLLNLTYSNSTSLFHSTNSSNYLNLSCNKTNVLSPGEESLMNISIEINTTKTNNDDGTYTGWIFLNDSDAHPYSGFNLTLQVILTDDLNVYITNISTADGDANIANASLQEDIVLSGRIYYESGVLISDLNLSDFGSVSLVNKNISNTITIPDSNLSENSGGLWQGNNYWINATLGGDSERPGGYYDVTLTANRLTGGESLSGSVQNGTLIIPGPGLKFGGDTSLDDFEEVNEEQYYNVSVTNYGTTVVDEDDIDLSVGGNSDCDDVLTIRSGYGDCGSSIGLGESCEISWEVESSDSDYVLNCEVNVETDVNHYDGLPGDSFQVSIDSGDDGNGGNGGNDVEDIDITDYPSSLTITQNKSKSFTITVENDGDTDEDDIELEITGISSDWYSRTPSNLDLDSGDEDDFSVTITVPADAEVKEYSLTFKVSNDDVSDSKTSKLKVIPSEEEKESINETYTLYLENYTVLEDQMNEMISDGKNVTEFNETLADIKSKLDSLQELIDEEDYFNAAQKLGEIESLLIIARSLVAQEETLKSGFDILEEGKNYVWLFIGVIVIIIVGFLIYMFLPPPKDKYKVKKFKYTAPGAGEPIGKKISKELRKIKAKLSGLKNKKEKDKGSGYSWKKKRREE